MKVPLISIGMPVYNCEATVAESIASILNQTFEDWELIVHDDGSEDRTLAIARRFTDPRIRIVEGGRNRGLSACLNRTIARCQGQFFARMDGDDIAFPNRLQLELDFLRTHAGVDLIAGGILVIRNNGEAVGARCGPSDHHQICAHPWSGFPMAHPTWMGRTAWFRSHPYRTDAVRMEDRELLFRTYRANTFANLPQVVLAYREDSLSLRKILTARRHTCRMMIRRAGEEGTVTAAALGILAQLVRGVVDGIAIGTGLEYRLLRHRAPAVPVELVRDWEQILAYSSATALNAIRTHSEEPT